MEEVFFSVSSKPASHGFRTTARLAGGRPAKQTTRLTGSQPAKRSSQVPLIRLNNRVSSEREREKGNIEYQNQNLSSCSVLHTVYRCNVYMIRIQIQYLCLHFVGSSFWLSIMANVCHQILSGVVCNCHDKPKHLSSSLR